MKITVIGSGSWGRALAKLWGAENIAGRAAPQKIDADIVVVAVKSANLHEVLKKHDYGNSRIVIACKGLQDVGFHAIISGPNFADEVEKGLPAVATLAHSDKKIGEILIAALGRPNFRLYYSDDIIGTQIGGAVKNVIAIATGICEGKNLGENARAAIITRGLAEIARLTKATGGKPESVMNPSGIGDLVLTATSKKSRNYKFGLEIANGKSVQNLLETEGVKEGYFAAKLVHDLALKNSVEMPICSSVYYILYEGKNIDVSVKELMERPQA